MLRSTYSRFGVVERRDFRFFLRVRANHAHAGKIFLRPRGERPQRRLNFFGKPVNDLAKIPDRNHHNGNRNQHPERERGESLTMKYSASTIVAMVVAVYMIPGPEHHAHGVQVVRCARHQIARAVAHVKFRLELHEAVSRSLRRSNSISRETPIRIQRVQNEKIPFTSIATTIVKQ